MAWEKVVIGAGVVGAVAVLAMLLWPLARHRFIYPGGELSPERADPALHGLPAAEQVWLEAEDGVRIHGWWTPAEGPGGRAPAGAVAGGRGTVIYCHGNAESLATRAWIADRLSRMGLQVLLFDYRGYGLSEGRPDEEGLARDARAAWRHVVEARGVDPGRVVLMGHSLGSAVATRLALELGAVDQGDGARSMAPGRPAALVVGSPFPSMPTVFEHHAPWLPARALRWRNDRHDAGARLDRADLPTLVIIGSLDEVIPPALSRRVAEPLGEAAVVTVPADHGAVMGHPEAWSALETFLAAVLEQGVR